MALKDVVETGRKEVPYRVLLAGVEGIGKTTFGTSAPSPIVIAGEDGAEHIDVARIRVRDWQAVLNAVDLLAVEYHEYQTVVVDTLDSLEPLLWDFICKRDGKSSIEDYGYGKGYVAALAEWRGFLRRLETLKTRGMNLILIAHTQIRLFKNPEGEDYDRYQLKLNDKASGFIKEWCEEVLFATYETFAKKERGALKAKGISTGNRVIYTQRTAAWDAKNRHNLPATLPLDFAIFAVAMRSGLDTSALKLTIEQKLPQIPEDKRQAVRTAVESARTHAQFASIIERMDKTIEMAANAGP